MNSQPDPSALVVNNVESEMSLMQQAINEWYRRETPCVPRRRAEVIAAEYGLNPDELHAACQADFAAHEDGFCDPAHDAF